MRRRHRSSTHMFCPLMVAQGWTAAPGRGRVNLGDGSSPFAGREAMDPRPHIVVVEDEATQRQLLADYLSEQNFRVSAVDGGAALHRLVDREAPALVLLDVHLPGEDGFALARWLREKSSRTGIIMVTSAADTVDRVVGLETGADDYITKPFEPRELLARVKSVLRRGAPEREAGL